jgi:alpha-1,3-rhamnosyl/mannosyltransferase
MIRAFQRFQKESGERHEFLLCGTQPEAFGYRKVLDADLEGPGIRRLGFVPEQDLPALLTGARALFHATSYEGFGMPVLEAFACGCPVITSSTTACAETAGDAALLVDPSDEPALVQALHRLTGDEPFRTHLIERGFRRAAEFSWSRTARRTLEVLQQAAARR